ncbi:MAG: hypothetical protein KDC26_13160 [Armatimonadetes bacterium]|nr:hypothetical protein [Armatimonadota bacterium]
MLTTAIAASLILAAPQEAGPKTDQNAKDTFRNYFEKDQKRSVPEHLHQITFLSVRSGDNVQASRFTTRLGPGRMFLDYRNLDDMNLRVSATETQIWSVDHLKKAYSINPIDPMQGLSTKGIRSYVFEFFNKAFAARSASANNPLGIGFRFWEGGIPEIGFAQPLEVKNKSKQGDLTTIHSEATIGDFLVLGTLEIEKDDRISRAFYDIQSDGGVFSISVESVRYGPDPAPMSLFEFPKDAVKGYQKSGDSEPVDGDGLGVSL